MFHLQLNGFRAWVSIDNVALDHYGVEVSSDQSEVTCWIPSEVGKHFVVNWTDTAFVRSMITHTAGWVTVDGYTAGGKVIAPSNDFSFASLDGVITSATTFRPFTFSSLDFTDDDAYLGNGASFQRLGEITLEIWTVITGDQYYATGDAVPQALKIHERSKKGVAHCIGFGHETYTSHPMVQTSSRRVSHLATFTFKYRSLDILRANGIVPCESVVLAQKRRAPGTPERDAEPDGDDEKPGVVSDTEELKALQDRMSAIHAKRAMTRDGAKRIKVESQ